MYKGNPNSNQVHSRKRQRQLDTRVHKQAPRQANKQILFRAQITAMSFHEKHRRQIEKKAQMNAADEGGRRKRRVRAEFATSAAC
jgi:hypothetical protein